MDDKFLKDLERTTLAENGQLDWRLELHGMTENTRINYTSRLGFFDKYMSEMWPGHPPEAPSDKMLAHFLIMEYLRGLGASGLKDANDCMLAKEITKSTQNQPSFSLRVYGSLILSSAGWLGGVDGSIRSVPGI